MNPTLHTRVKIDILNRIFSGAPNQAALVDSLSKKLSMEEIGAIRTLCLTRGAA